MAQYRTIHGRLVFSTLATFVGATLFLLSACQNSAPVPEPTKVAQPPSPSVLLTPVTPPANFAFLFEWSSCGTYTVTTFDNRLTLESNYASPPITTTTNFVLSYHELSTIYQKMVDIGLFSYPEEFSIQLPTNVIRVYGIPALYRFDIREGESRKTTYWNDEFSEPGDMPWKSEDSEPSRTRATKLSELIKLIQQIVMAHPEFEKLPGPGGCA